MAKRKTFDALELAVELSVSPKRLYEAWIDGNLHAAMTGAPATSDPRVGGRFTAWDGYIEGTHLELSPGERIVQSWRTSEFPEGAPDSKLEIQLEKTRGGTRLTLRHTEIPKGDGARYEQGWDEFYFVPMSEYFGR